MVRSTVAAARRAGSVVQPFRVAIEQQVLDRIADRVRESRFPATTAAADSWEHGMSVAAMKALATYWVAEYDWRRSEAELNRYPQFRATVDGTSIHFYHVIGKGKRPLPVLFTHAWPGSVYEFLDVIERLTDPEHFGGQTDDSLTVVIPSLPGFAFSSQLPDGRVGPVSTAQLWHKLMTEVLGYQRFGVQGGDLGCIVSTQLAHLFPERVVGLHLNLVPPPLQAPGQATSGERRWAQASAEFKATELDYFQMHAHKPATVGLALFDNPVGTAAWMLEKFHLWSDAGPELTPPFSQHQLITAVMIYLVTDTVASSVWFYEGLLRETGGRTHPGERITVPTAVADFPKDLINGRPPQSLIEYGYNLVRYTQLSRGGHFAALEQPALFAQNVVAFFRSLREA
jgi:pimeloyl-ACP methyl ester carboxylesterase